MDWSSDTPPAAKDIAAHYRQSIANGELAAGQQLPTARALAKRLRVALMTVQSAYTMLREDGLVESRQGSGTYVRSAEIGSDAQETAHGLRELHAELQRASEQIADLSERVTALEAEAEQRPAANS